MIKVGSVQVDTTLNIKLKNAGVAHPDSYREVDDTFRLLKEQICGSSSVGRAIAFQAIGRGFEPRLPLLIRRAFCQDCFFCHYIPGGDKHGGKR